MVILVLVLLNGVFAGAEIALLSLRRTRVGELVAEGRLGAISVQELQADPERLLATVQVGITVVGSTAAAFGGASASAHLARVLEPFAGERAEALAFAVTVALVSYLSLVLGELVPKSLALRSAETYGLLVAPLLRAVAWAAAPLVFLLTGSSNLVLRVFGDRTSFSESRLSPDELRQLVDEAATAGTVDEHAGEIASRALQFSDLHVHDVIVPRSDIVAVRPESSLDALAELARRTGHSRILVQGADLDDVRGYVHVRELLARARTERVDTVAIGVQPVPFVPITMAATTLLRQLQHTRTHLAVAVDEQGTVRGLVTLGDLVEELVGSMLSVEDRPSDHIVPELEGRFIAPAATPIREVNRVLGLALPASEASSTLGGLVLGISGRIPAPGELFERDGVGFEIVAASRRRVKVVRILCRRAPTPHAATPRSLAL